MCLHVGLRKQILHLWDPPCFVCVTTIRVPRSKAQACYYHIPCHSSPNHMTCQVRIGLLSNTLSSLHPAIPPSPPLFLVHQTVTAWVEGGMRERERSLFIEAEAKEGELRVESKIKLAISPFSPSLSLSISLFFLLLCSLTSSGRFIHRCRAEKGEIR